MLEFRTSMLDKASCKFSFARNGVTLFCPFLGRRCGAMGRYNRAMGFVVDVTKRVVGFLRDDPRLNFSLG